MVISYHPSPLRFMQTGMLICVVLLMNGCSKNMDTINKQGDNTPRTQILRKLQCGEQETLEEDRLLPPALYKKMNQCVEKKHYQEATLLFALAGSYTWYDANYLDTSFARKKHRDLLADTLEKLEPESREILWENINSTLGNKKKLTLTCQKVKLIGRPKYFMSYMKQQPPGEENHENQRWDMALENYLHCQKMQ